MTKIMVSTTYSAHCTSELDLGCRDWDDVEETFIKWDVITVRFKDGKELVTYIGSDAEVDSKYPDDVRFYSETYDEELEPC